MSAMPHAILDMVEVLQPQDLRRKLARAARQVRAMYDRRDTDGLQDSPRDVTPGAAHEELEAGPTPDSGSVQLRLFDDSAPAEE